jgi:predicted O-methyltransferase YrrM
MSASTNTLEPRIADYVASVAATREDVILARLREATAPLPLARMQISVEQGQLMTLLVEAIGARRAIEVGVFTGYSALCVARALGPGGRLLACDVSEEWTAIGRPFWAEAGVAARIDLRLAPASETLQAAIAAGEAGTYDFAFIDADKEAYDGYYEQSLTLLRPGGLVALDNMLWHGKVVDPPPGDAETLALRRLTEKIFADERVTPSLVPIGDGLVLARKRT